MRRPGPARDPDREWSRISRYFDDEARDEDAFRVDDRTWSDLDMAAVFTTIDRTCSSVGQALLYHMMRTPLSGKAGFTDRAAKIRGLAEDPASRSRLRRILSRLGFQRGGELYAFLGYVRGTVDNARRFLFLIMGAAVVPAIACVVFLGVPALPALAALVIANFIIHFSMKAQIEAEVPYYGYLHALLSAARRLSRQRIPAVAQEIDALARLVPVLKRLSRSTVFMPMNQGLSGDVTAVFWDLLKIVFLLEVTSFHFSHNRMAKLAGELKALYATVGTIDALAAVAELRAEDTRFTTPDVVEGARLIDAKRMSHPLLEKAVPNSISLDGRGVVVTGSNMSGKSTFLRTLGVNQLLSTTLCMACAAGFRTSFLVTVTSITTRDSILRAESHYLSEAARMRLIVRRAESGFPLLVIIDEILSGTNSVERIAASIRILRFISSHGCLVAAATHDRDIGFALEDSHANVHFTHMVNGSGIEFDYILKPGIVEEGNAVKLLRHLGFPPQITDGLDDG